MVLLSYKNKNKMGLATKYFLNYLSYKSISTCNCIFSKSRVRHAQFHLSGNNPATGKSLIFKYKIPKEPYRNVSTMQFVKDKTTQYAWMANQMVERVQSHIPGVGLKYKMQGYLWYKTLDEINVQDFFDVFQMYDTFYSRHKVIELHVCMLLYHFPTEKKHQRLLRLGLLNAMWDESEVRARVVDSVNLNFKKNFKTLFGKFLLTSLLYDDGFSRDDTALFSSLWCAFFNREAQVSPLLIEALVSYCRYQMNHLNKMNINGLSENKNKENIWLPMRPHVEAFFKNTQS